MFLHIKNCQILSKRNLHFFAWLAAPASQSTVLALWTSSTALERSGAAPGRPRSKGHRLYGMVFKISSSFLFHHSSIADGLTGFVALNSSTGNPIVATSLGHASSLIGSSLNRVRTRSNVIGVNLALGLSYNCLLWFRI